MVWSERQLQMLRAMGVPARLPARSERPSLAAGAEDSLRESPAAPVVTAPAPLASERRRDATPPSPRFAVPVAMPAPSGDMPNVAGLGWDELRATVAACQACNLCQTRQQTVFGVGHPKATWMVVGEAPGEQEDATGQPFVGAAGQLLDRMLAALGLTRDEAGEGAALAQRVYIANALKCRPPRNRNPDPSEMAKCEPYLIRQIELLQPKLILAMGRFAVQALLRSDEAIGRLRGRVHRYQGVPLIVTYHPAYLLRNPADKAKSWDDLCLAAATLSSIGAQHG